MFSTRLIQLANLFFLLTLVIPFSTFAENDEQYLSTGQDQITETKEPPAPSSSTTDIKKGRNQQKRKYLTDDSPRVDSGVFHVGIAGGGNFYTEPAVDANNQATGESYKDFGFQAGVYFDWDYSELDENIPLGLRGMFGYKYILSSVHVFTFDGVVRRMWRFSERASFGLGFGGSAAVWYRVASDQVLNQQEEVIFLPSLILSGGFEFAPFMADLKILVNRWSSDRLIAGAELYFGFRL